MAALAARLVSKAARGRERLVDMAAMRRTFEDLDQDDSGLLSRNEVCSMIARLGEDPSDKRVDAAMEAMDRDRSGQVDFDEFTKWWKMQPDPTLTTGAEKVQQRLQERIRELDGLASEQEANILYAFELIDADGSGRLDGQEVQAAMRKMGVLVGPEGAAEAFVEMEKGPDNQVGFFSFRRWWMGLVERGDERVTQLLGDKQAESSSGGAAAGLTSQTKLTALALFRAPKGGLRDRRKKGDLPDPKDMTEAQWLERGIWR